MQQGTNLPRIGSYNQTVVFDAVRRAPHGLTQAELARATGLSPQTLTNVSRRLLQHGLIQQGDLARPERGRPSRRLVLNPAGRRAVGVQIDPASLTLVLVDLAGAMTAHRTVSTPESGDPADMIALLVRAVQHFIADEAAGADILGLGIGSPGPIDMERGIVLDPPHLPAWHTVELRDNIAAHLALPVLLDKDVIVDAFAHTWLPNSPQFRNAAFIYLGTGVAISASVDGKVIRGVAGNAGEAGHIKVGGTGSCPQGHRGCLGTIASLPAIIRTAAQQGLPVLSPGDDPDNAILADRALTALLGVAADGDERAIELLREVGSALAEAGMLVADLLGLDTVVASGSIWDRVSPWVAPAVAGAIASHGVIGTARQLRFLPSPLGADVGAIGAACMVLDELFSPDPAKFVLSN